LAGVALLWAAACGSSAPSQIQSTWKDPQTTSVRFKKVVALAVHPDENTREAIERAIVKRMPNAVASYTFVPHADLADREKVKAAIQATDADGVVVVRVLNVDTEQTPVAGGGDEWGQGTTSLWEHYEGTMGTSLDPTAVQTMRNVTIRTDIF